MDRYERAVARFWARIRKTDSCWLWMGCLAGGGYGRIRDGDCAQVPVHRFMYEHAVGPVPAGLFVLHSCDVRNCVNPAHLFLGTQADNMQDKVNKGRQAQGESSATSKLTAVQVRELRERYAAGGITAKELGLKYGVTESAICYIINRKVWRSA